MTRFAHGIGIDDEGKVSIGRTLDIPATAKGPGLGFCASPDYVLVVACGQRSIQHHAVLVSDVPLRPSDDLHGISHLEQQMNLPCIQVLVGQVCHAGS